MQLYQLSLKHRSLFDKFLFFRQHDLAAYAFENIFIWQKLYKIFWAKIDNKLCVFFKDRVGCFMYLPPLGRDVSAEVIRGCFEIMDMHNKNEIIARIENVEKQDIGYYKKLGFETILGGRDYVCKKSDLVALKGNRFKGKRAAVNSFEKKYKFQYWPYKNTDKSECIRLYRLWIDERKVNNKDVIYQSLLEDNFTAFKTAIHSYNKLGFMGKVIKINNRIQAVTIGYPLGRETFVVLFEVCNLKFKGIAQHIFREFCREQPFKDINIMDDSGLDSLKKVKLSYRPHKTVDNFIVRNA
ncbi:DUF2156 domain-containing protein [Candidatus Omnitrophota bacterium]